MRHATRVLGMALMASLALLASGCAGNRAVVEKQKEIGKEGTMGQPGGADGVVTGLWEGYFEFRGQKVAMSVDFDAGTLSIPPQGLKGQPLENRHCEPPRVSFSLVVGGGVQFEGELTAGGSGKVIAGSFRQPGAEGTFQLAPAGEAEEDTRFSGAAIIGHSEGSLVGMVAARRAGARAFVSIAGAGRPLYETILDQLRARAPELVTSAESIIGSLRKGERVPKLTAELESLFRPSVQPFLTSLFRYDPAVEIAGLEIPVLIVNGSHDLQASVEEARLLAEAQRAAELQIIQGMNHVLKQAPADPQGNFATYGDPDLPLDEGLPKAVGGFLRTQLGTRSR